MTVSEMEKPAKLKQLGMMIDLSRCIGCATCIVACRNHKGLVDHETARPGNIPFYIRGEHRIVGTYPNLKMENWVVPCLHCPDPECVSGCPENSIIKDERTGVVLMPDKDTCTGCMSCMDVCPYDVIQFDKKTGVAHKCDLCWEEIQAGEDPICAQVCMTNAIRFGEYDTLKMQAEAEGKEIDWELSKESILYVK